MNGGMGWGEGGGGGLRLWFTYSDFGRPQFQMPNIKVNGFKVHRLSDKIHWRVSLPKISRDRPMNYYFSE